MATPISTAEINSIRLIVQGSGPTTPPSNHENIYIKSGGLYRKNSSGTEIPILDSAALTEALKTPPAIGGTTPNTGAFTTLSSSAGLSTTGVDTFMEKDGGSFGLWLDSYSLATAILGRRANGSKSSPTQVLSGQGILAFSGLAFHSGGAFATVGPRFLFAAAENQTSTAWGCTILLDTIKSGTTTRLTRATIANDGAVTLGQNMDQQFPVQLLLPEGTHASSKRVAFQFGNNWSMQADSAGNGTRDFGIFSVVQNVNVVSCDVNGVPGFQGLNAATAATFRAAIMNVASTGTPAAGFGGELAFIGQSASQFGRDMARLTWEWIVATDASRTGKGKLWAGDSAAWREALGWGSSGTAAQLGFFGTAPIVKPAATGSRGGNVALASLLTALANLGLITDSTVA